MSKCCQSCWTTRKLQTSARLVSPLHPHCKSSAQNWRKHLVFDLHLTQDHKFILPLNPITWLHVHFDYRPKFGVNLTQRIYWNIIRICNFWKHDWIELQLLYPLKISESQYKCIVTKCLITRSSRQNLLPKYP